MLEGATGAGGSSPGTDTGGSGLGSREYERADIGAGYGGTGPGFGGGSPAAVGTGGFGRTSAAVATESRAAEAIYAAGGQPFASNPTTPSFSNFQVYNPSLGQRIVSALAALPVIGPLALGGSRLSPNFGISGPTPGGGPEALGAGTGTTTTTTTAAAPGTTTATVTDPLAALAGELGSLFAGGAGPSRGAGPALGQQGLTYVPTTKTGSALGLILILAGLAAVGYWWWRRRKTHD